MPSESGRLRSALKPLAISVCLAAGGVLWALSPVGVHVSEIKFKSPEVFWKLFPSAPLLMGLGLLALLLGRDSLGRLGKLSVGMTLAGILLVVAGDVGLFYLHLDDRYITLAPAWRVLRLGFVLFCSGSIFFGVAAARMETAPLWGALPLALVSLGGLIAVLEDQGSFGLTLWAAFGLGWAWFGLSLFAGYVLGLLGAGNTGSGHGTRSRAESKSLSEN